MWYKQQCTTTCRTANIQYLGFSLNPQLQQGWGKLLAKAYRQSSPTWRGSSQHAACLSPTTPASSRHGFPHQYQELWTEGVHPVLCREPCTAGWHRRDWQAERTESWMENNHKEDPAAKPVISEWIRAKKIQSKGQKELSDKPQLLSWLLETTNEFLNQLVRKCT